MFGLRFITFYFKLVKFNVHFKKFDVTWDKYKIMQKNISRV